LIIAGTKIRFMNTIKYGNLPVETVAAKICDIKKPAQSDGAHVPYVEFSDVGISSTEL
jgi:hypothetical protein